MTSARQCKNILLHRKAYSTRVKFYVRHHNKTNVTWADDQIRRNTPIIVEKYGELIGKRPSLSPDFVRLSDSIYFPQFLNGRTTLKDHIFYVHYIPLVNLGRPINAHFVISSLYNYGMRKLRKRLNIDVRFHAVRNQTQLENGAFDYPQYLKNYFEESDIQRKCLYVDIIAGYTHHPRSDVISGFQVYKLSESDLSICAQGYTSKENRSNKLLIHADTNKKEETTKVENKIKVPIHTNKFIHQKYEQSRSQRLNNLEIIMIVALSLVFILSTLFFTICAVYVRRKRKQHSHIIRIVSTTPLKKTSIHRNDLHPIYKKNNKHQNQHILYIQEENSDDKSVGEMSYESASNRSITNSTSVNSDSISQLTRSSQISFERNILKKTLQANNLLNNRPYNSNISLGENQRVTYKNNEQNNDNCSRDSDNQLYTENQGLLENQEFKQPVNQKSDVIVTAAGLKVSLSDGKETNL